jgi:hypothetical protein
MRTKVVTVVLVSVAGLHLARSTAGQVRPVPGAGTGIVTVQGEVDVRQLPPLEVGQRGEWRVSLANAADVRVVNTPAVASAPPPFLRAGGRYEVTWPGGERETFTLAQPGTSGWVRAASEGRERWLNLSTARTIQELP